MIESSGVADAIEEVASEKLGVEPWNRPAIFREAATAATENGLPFWSVLALSGGIATLGLALNNSAVVIGAMLVAPLLAPVIGLALSLAVGDGRLAFQTGVVVAVSTATVVGVSALLTIALPFHTVTLEILARTRPTTLDLAIAVFSGLVGAVVSVGRGTRLSAAIPGVAIAVALIPPLAVAGFGVGIGRWDLIWGSLLLYGANLAGIVLSGMLVFLLVGMHRPEVADAATQWHHSEGSSGLAAKAGHIRWIRSLGVFRSPWARSGLVLAFVVALGIPLWESLEQIARESRVDRAVAEMEEEIFDRPGRASVLSRQVNFGSEGTQVYLRIATSEWFTEEARQAFELGASTRSGEPIVLTLEQLPAGGADPEQLIGMFPVREPQGPASAPTPARLAELIPSAQRRLNDAIRSIVLPSDVQVMQANLTIDPASTPRVLLVYAAVEPLPLQAEEIIRNQLVRALELPEVTVELEQVEPVIEEISDTTPDVVSLEAESSLPAERQPGGL